MKITINSFRGRLPRVSPRALPAGYAQIATSPRLLSGDLESWTERVQLGTLAKAKPINTIHLLAQRIYSADRYWLQWRQDELAAGATNVDVALGPIPGDQLVATFFTGAGATPNDSDYPLDGPRYTNLDLATNPAYQGVLAAGAYPYRTRALGIDAPTAAPAVVQTIPVVPPGMESFNYDGSDISDWSELARDGGTTKVSTWDVGTFPVTGEPAFKATLIRNAAALLQQDFKLDSSAAFNITFDFYLDSNTDPGGWKFFFLSQDMAGPSIFIDRNGGVIYNEGTGTTQRYDTAGIERDAAHTLTVTAMLRDDGYYGVTAVFTQGMTTEFTLTGRAQAISGFFGFEDVSDSANTVPRYLYVKNIVGNVVSMDPTQPLPVYSNWVYTLINSLGQESAPSPPSTTYSVDNGITNAVTIPAQDPDADIASVRLYRASTSASSAAYLFVDDIAPPYPATYVDTKTSLQIGPDELLTTDYDPPPAGLQGLLALPSGALVAFVGNQLCFSEIGYPYAWPIKYRITVDFPIKGIGAIDTNVTILTQAFPYIAQGGEPGTYQVAKLEYPQGCISKRSIAYVSGVGVLYATPDGLYAISGGSAPVCVTEQLYAQREWRLLNPSTMIGVSHDDRYFGFYDATDIGGTKGAVIIDFRPNGFGLIDLPDHATATYADPIDDTLYMVTDDDYPLPVQTGVALLAWDRGGDDRRPYVWRSRLYLQAMPESPLIAQVKAEDYDDLTFRLYADGMLLHEVTIDSDMEFTLPPYAARAHEIELAGTSRVYQVEIADDVEELA